MKKWVWRFHSWVGLITGLGLIVIGVTGSLLVFHAEIDALLSQSEPTVAPGATRAPLDVVVAAALAEWVAAVWWPARKREHSWARLVMF